MFFHIIVCKKVMDLESVGLLALFLLLSLASLDWAAWTRERTYLRDTWGMPRDGPLGPPPAYSNSCILRPSASCVCLWHNIFSYLLSL